MKIEDLLDKFVQEIALHLEIKHVYVLTYDLQTHQVTSTSTSKEYTQHQMDEILLENLRMGM